MQSSNGRTGINHAKDILTHRILDYVTFTINTLDPKKALGIYRGIKDIEAAEQMIYNQIDFYI